MPRFSTLSETTTRMSATSFGPFAARMKELAAAGRLAPLHLGDTWLPPPPAARQLDLGDNPVHRYAPVDGLPELREAVAARMTERHEIPTESDGVLITPGSTGGLSIAVEALFDPGDEVLLMTPSWPLIFGIFQRRGVVINEVPVGLSGWPDDVEAFEARLRAAVTERTAGLYLCDPNNPCGFVYPEAYRDAIERVVLEHDLWLITDVAYLELAWKDNGRILPRRESLRSRTITAGTFSKIFALAGHRVGFLLVPEPARPVMTRLITHTTYHTSTSAQRLALACLREGGEEPIARSYADGARVTAEELRARFHPAEAGAFVFLDFRGLGLETHEQTLEFLGTCLDAGVALCPGRVFGERFAPFARLCFTTLPEDDLRAALELLNPLLAGTLQPRA